MFFAGRVPNRGWTPFLNCTPKSTQRNTIRIVEIRTLILQSKHSIIHVITTREKKPSTLQSSSLSQYPLGSYKISIHIFLDHRTLGEVLDSTFAAMAGAFPANDI